MPRHHAPGPWVCWILLRITSGVVMFGALSVLAIAAEPYIPSSDAEVLETLPKYLLSGRDELTTLRRELANAPKHESTAVDVASRFMQLGGQSGDPRFFGYARAALRPWWEIESPSPQILKLRAKLYEKEHRYDAALTDLKRLLAKQPRDAQAWIEVANINRVLGRYEDAKKACASLSEFAGPVPICLCRAPLQFATGEAQAAYDSLEAILPLAQQQFPSTVQFILTMQSQISQSLGRIEDTERYLRNGLFSNPIDNYLMRSYADFLLDNDRADEALRLLKDHTNDNGILLRAAIAARRVGDEKLARDWTQRLENRFEEIRLRGSEPHGRFESRFELELKDNPHRALALALANWQKQKENRDTRNVLEAALAANEPDAAKPVLDFLTKYSNEDVLLRELARRLERE